MPHFTVRNYYEVCDTYEVDAPDSVQAEELADRFASLHSMMASPAMTEAQREELAQLEQVVEQTGENEDAEYTNTLIWDEDGNVIE